MRSYWGVGRGVSLENSAIYDNEIDALSSSTTELAFGTNVNYSTNANVINKTGPSSYTAVIINDRALAFPVAQNGCGKLRVAVSLEETTSFYFIEWLAGNTATNVQITGLSAEILAAVPTGTGGTDGRQIHYAVESGRSAIAAAGIERLTWRRSRPAKKPFLKPTKFNRKCLFGLDATASLRGNADAGNDKALLCALAATPKARGPTRSSSILRTLAATPTARVPVRSSSILRSQPGSF